MNSYINILCLYTIKVSLQSYIIIYRCSGQMRWCKGWMPRNWQRMFQKQRVCFKFIMNARYWSVYGCGFLKCIHTDTVYMFHLNFVKLLGSVIDSFKQLTYSGWDRGQEVAFCRCAWPWEQAGGEEALCLGGNSEDHRSAGPHQADAECCMGQAQPLADPVSRPPGKGCQRLYNGCKLYCLI